MNMLRTAAKAFPAPLPAMYSKKQSPTLYLMGFSRNDFFCYYVRVLFCVTRLTCLVQVLRSGALLGDSKNCHERSNAMMFFLSFFLQYEPSSYHGM